MCGRYYFNNKEVIENISIELYQMIVSMESNLSQIEVKPGDIAPVLVKEGQTYVFKEMKWGFITSNGNSVINARCETIHDRKLFSWSADNGRCVIPASGYFEWRKQDGQKYAFSCDHKLIYMAGLCRYVDDGYQFVVLTRDATSEISEIHNRMPLILKDRESIIKWMNGSSANSFSHDRIALCTAACGNEQLRMVF